MTTHTGPAPLESPEAMAERLGGRQFAACLDAIRARDAQWAERLEAMQKDHEREAIGFKIHGKAAGEIAANAAAAALRDAAKMGETK